MLQNPVKLINLIYFNVLPISVDIFWITAQRMYLLTDFDLNVECHVKLIGEIKN